MCMICIRPYKHSCLSTQHHTTVSFCIVCAEESPAWHALIKKTNSYVHFTLTDSPSRAEPCVGADFHQLQCRRLRHLDHPTVALPLPFLLPALSLAFRSRNHWHAHGRCDVPWCSERCIHGLWTISQPAISAITGADLIYWYIPIVCNVALVRLTWTRTKKRLVCEYVYVQKRYM